MFKVTVFFLSSLFNVRKFLVITKAIQTSNVFFWRTVFFLHFTIVLVEYEVSPQPFTLATRLRIYYFVSFEIHI